ncbi:hypothetical protein AB6A40_004653 [Gnathostoma spinigerum]|uniref:Solute carrier family 25 member 51 n=1 Tax=Gnathostoma spinigerum TaxID=75299 RepID=A0ABD6EKT7_9BILA
MLSRIPQSRKEFICGWGAGCIETCTLFPLNKLIFRQQLHGVVFGVAFGQLRSEGISLLYRGLLPPLIMRTTTRALMFGMYDEFCRALKCQRNHSLSAVTPCHAIAGLLAGSMEAVLCPLERVQVLLQSSAFHKRFENSAHALKVVARIGPREMYRGLTLVVFRNGLSNAVFFSLRDPLRNSLLAYNGSGVSEISNKRIPTSLALFSADFISGAILGAVISTVFFPINVVKQRMQSTMETKFLSGWRVLNLIWEERNRRLIGLYRGAQLNFTRSLISWGITNSVYELLRRLYEQRSPWLKL